MSIYWIIIVVDILIERRLLLCSSYTMNWFCHVTQTNIWSHLFGLAFFIGLILYTFMTPIHANASIKDYLLLLWMLVSASYMFLCSTLFHLNICVSHEACRFFGCLDYSGISALILGGTAVSTYYILYCDYSRRPFILLLILSNLVGIIGPYFEFLSF
jgi:adiponectin receptor